MRLQTVSGRHRLLAVLLAALLLAPAAAAPPLNAYQATYRVEQGKLTSQLEMRLQRDGRWWRLESRSKPGGLLSLFAGAHASELSVLETSGGALRPVAYNYTAGADPSDRDVASFFDWRGETLISTRGTRLLEAPLEAGTFDRLSVLLAIAQGLRAGRREMDIPVAAKGRVRRKHYKVDRHETLHTKAGSFDTVRVTEVRPGRKRYTVSWFASAHHFLPVRIDQYRGEEFKGRLELTEVSWQP